MLRDYLVKDKILEGAEKLFFQYGVRSVSMDDVARELSVSKKTLYQYFTNKDELVVDVTELSLTKEKEQFKGISEDAENAINELFLLSACIRHTVNHINPALIYDLKKYHPEAWEKFQTYKYDFVRGTVMDNIRRGKSEGYYRSELNEEVLSILRVEGIQMIFDGVFSKITNISFAEIHMQLFDHFVYGLLTPEGTAQFEMYKADELNIELTKKPL
ncbi:MAG: AcrR family transcriptional regulator [Cyclobacteriaceae bacterium]